MTTYTNLSNLPAPFPAMLSHDSYDAGDSDLTATQLGRAPYAVALAKRHGEQADITERLWSVFGQAIHHLLDRSGQAQGLWTETRWFATVRGWLVSGQFDAYDPATRTLRDYKCVGYYTFRDGVKPEYVQQLNVLRWLGMQQSPAVIVDRLEILAIYRDWKATDARAALAAGKGDYPTRPVAIWDVDRWDLAETERWVDHRVGLHQQAQQAMDAGEPVPVCTPTERWYRPATKRGPAAYPMCQDWCPVRHVCPHAHDVAPATKES